MAKSLTAQIKYLKEQNRQLERQLQEVKDDRQKLRDYWAKKMKWFIELHGKQQTPSTAFLIEDMSKLFSRVEYWWW